MSEAPLEIIKAENSAFQFLIDTSESEFAVSVPIRQFQGFNSALQQAHFFENYMETDRYETASFAGKILDPFDYGPEPFSVLVRGRLKIHGVTKERIIEAHCKWLDNTRLEIKATFDVPLKDHDIEIPRIVFQKIAEIISVDISAELIPGK